MKSLYRILTAPGAVIATLFSMAAPLGLAQAGDEERSATEEAERQLWIAQTLATEGRQLTIVDREGRVVGMIGDREMFASPVFSPDRSRVAVVRNDLQTVTDHLWIFDVATGKGIQVTENAAPYILGSAWSPDGRYVAYAAVRDGYYALYQAAANGDGDEKLIYRHKGGTIILTDWSLDGRFLSFFSTDPLASSLYLFDIDHAEVIEAAPSDSGSIGARMSPDGRFLAYVSGETGKDEIFVRAVSAPGQTGKAKTQVSTDGGLGMVHWRQDGRELYYLGPGRRVMAVAVNTTRDAFEFDEPRLLFRAPDTIPAGGRPGGLGNVSKDGERVIFALPPSQPLRQIAVLDRDGEVVSRIGEPGYYSQPTFSPDGSRVAVLLENPQTGNDDIWRFDVATGRSAQVTDTDQIGEKGPVWTPDGDYVAYANFDVRTEGSTISRKTWRGEGTEELLFRGTSFLSFSDISRDGKYLTFESGGTILTVPLAGDSPVTEAIEYSREAFQVGMPRFSPNSRFMAYVSNETGRFEVYVRPFDPSTGRAPDEGKWRISDSGAVSAVSWRADGKELFYLKGKTETPQLDDLEVIAVDVKTVPTFEVLGSRVLFEVSLPLIGGRPRSMDASADGQRFLFALSVAD